MQDGLGVAVRAQHVAAGDQPLTQLPVVVDLAVEDDDLGAIFVEDRLLAAAQIDDAETSHAESDGTLDEDPLVVRTPMLERRAHALHEIPGNRTTRISVRKPRDAAHYLSLSSSSRNV